MVITHNCASGDVRTTLNYVLPNPYGTGLYATQPRLESPRLEANFIFDPRNVVVHDLRGAEKNFSLDVNGFEFLVHETTESFLDEGSIQTNYYAEIRQLLKERTGAHRVFVITHRIRQSYDLADPEHGGDRRETEPAHNVHTDRTAESVVAEVKKYLGEDGERLLQGRVQFINVWRPIGQEVHHEPLAVADWQTSSDASNLVPLHVETASDTFDALVSRFNAKHSWYYLSHQAPAEITLLKFYDSSKDGSATFCLHSAFHDPGCHKGAPRRRSIEVSTLVFG